MSDQEMDFSARAIAWILSHVNVARLTQGLYLWLLRKGVEWATQEIDKATGGVEPQPEVRVTVEATRPKPSTYPTDEQMWADKGTPPSSC